MTGFQLSPRARFDIEDALDYLSQRSESAAVRWEDELYGAIRRLVAFPLSAAVRAELAPVPIRVQTIGRHLVFYDPTHEPVLILRVVRASREISRLTLLTEKS